MVKCSKKEYCESKGTGIFDCSDSEGCMVRDGKCTINDSKNLPNTLFNGGFGYGKVCVPDVMTDFVIMLVYPPAYVFLYQKKRGFPNIMMIITSFILTSCFYFPGLIHAMYLKQTGQSACGGLFTGEKSKKNVIGGIGGVGAVAGGTAEGVGSVGDEAVGASAEAAWTGGGESAMYQAGDDIEYGANQSGEGIEYGANQSINEDNYN